MARIAETHSGLAGYVDVNAGRVDVRNRQQAG